MREKEGVERNSWKVTLCFCEKSQCVPASSASINSKSNSISVLINCLTINIRYHLAVTHLIVPKENLNYFTIKFIALAHNQLKFRN